MKTQIPEVDASRDMLESTRLELEILREAMGVPVEPHQSLSDRMLEAVEELKEKLVSTEQRLQRRMEDIQEQAKRYVTLESNCQAIAAQNEALRSALEVIAGKRQCCDNTLSNLEVARYALNLPNLAAEILRKRDAATLRRAAKRFECAVYTGHVSTVLSLWAADIEKETT